MLKRLSSFIALLAAALLLCGCPSVDPGDGNSERRTVLLYLAADNSLGGDDYYTNYAQNNIDSLMSCRSLPMGTDKDNVLLVYLDMRHKGPQLLRLSQDRDGAPSSTVLMAWDDTVNSASAQQLHTVLSVAAEMYPSRYNGLILWSHGSGWLPEDYYRDPNLYDKAGGGDWFLMQNAVEHFPSLEDDPYRHMVKSFGEDDRREIDIQDLADALPIRYDYIIFDACLMGGVEVAYELRNNCNFVAFSQTEIIADGFPYAKLCKRLFNEADRIGDRQAVIDFCRDYFEVYDSKTSHYSRSATISVVECLELDGLADACRTICDNHHTQIESFRAADKVQGYFRNGRHWFYDLEDYLRWFAAPSEKDALDQALERAVIYKATTGFFMDFDIIRYSGLSTYIYEPSRTYLNDFYVTLDWNRAVGLVR